MPNNGLVNGLFDGLFNGNLGDHPTDRNCFVTIVISLYFTSIFGITDTHESGTY